MLSRKKLILFDVDGTLAPSKKEVSKEMAEVLTVLLKYTQVGIISGGRLETLNTNVLEKLTLSDPELLSRFHILPTCGARYIAYEAGAWKEIYAHCIDKEERQRIADRLLEASQGEYEKKEVFGDIIEDRETQLTFSMFGQHAPLHIKENADKDKRIRERIVAKVLPELDEYEVRIGGATSIDVTKKGIDKGYGITMIAQHLGITFDDICFVGDATFPGGNDYPAVVLGLDVVTVRDPDDTLAILTQWLHQEA